MGLLGNSWDDPQSSAIMALSAGLLNRNLGAGLMGANQAYAQHGDSQLKRGLLQAQIAETMAQADERKSKLALAQAAQARQDQFLNGGPASAPSGAPGAAGPSQGAASQSGGLIEQARAMGIPEKAIQADVVFNGGKGISDMIFKRGTPDMQVTGNYAYDKNKLGAGFMPSLNTSQDGKTSMVQIGPDGMPVVSAPQGAFNTFAGYQNIQEGTKANYDPQTVQPAGQAPQMTSRGALMRNPQVQGTQIPPGLQASRDAGRTEILQQELAKAQGYLTAALRSGDASAAARAQTDIASLQREMGGRTATVGMPLASEEDKLRASEGAKADTKRNTEVSANVEKSRDMTRQIERAKNLLAMDPTASGVGALMDKGAAAFGISTKGAETAAALDNVSGWLTSNVPRMEGPQSNFDVENYKVMAGRVGDRTLPVAQRMAALTEVENMQKKDAQYNGGSSAQPSGAPKVNFRYVNGKLQKAD